MVKIFSLLIVLIHLTCSTHEVREIPQPVEKNLNLESVKKTIKTEENLNNPYVRTQISDAIERCENINKELNLYNTKLLNQIEELKTKYSKDTDDLKSQLKSMTDKYADSQRDAGKFDGIQFIIISVLVLFGLIILFIVIKKFAGSSLPGASQVSSLLNLISKQ